MNSKYPYVLAIISGLVIPFIPEIDPLLLTRGLIYFSVGSLFGFFWPNESWRWWLWIVGPTAVLLSLSILFAGQLDIFLKKDLPILLIAFISVCLGSFLFSRFKHNRTKETEK
jgi:hypothetical protein